MPRRPLLAINPEIKATIMAMVRSGAYPERAAVAAGVTERAHYLWQAKGLEEREHRESGKAARKTFQVYLDYVDDLDQAIAQAEIALIGKVTEGASGWQGSMTLLERRFRDRWSGKLPPAKPAAAAAPAKGTVLDQLAARRTQRGGKKTGS